MLYMGGKCACLIYCGLVTPFGNLIWVNIVSGAVLWSGGTRQLPKPKLTSYYTDNPEISNIRRNQPKTLNDSCLVLQFGLTSPFKRGVMSGMKM